MYGRSCVFQNQLFKNDFYPCFLTRSSLQVYFSKRNRLCMGGLAFFQTHLFKKHLYPCFLTMSSLQVYFSKRNALCMGGLAFSKINFSKSISIRVSSQCLLCKCIFQNAMDYGWAVLRFPKSTFQKRFLSAFPHKVFFASVFFKT